MKVYLASPFFNDEQRAEKARVKEYLINIGCEVIDPQEVEKKERENFLDSSNHSWGLKTFFSDISKINSCDYIVAIDWGLYGDCGTAWEIGYGYAKGILVLVLVPEQTKNIPHSLMIANGSENFITIEHFLDGYDQESMLATCWGGDFDTTIEQK